MTNLILELVGIAAGIAALACFVVAAWSVSTVLGICVLGAALAVVSVVMIAVANRTAP